MMHGALGESCRGQSQRGARTRRGKKQRGGRTFCNVRVEAKLDAVADVDERVDGAADGAREHLAVAAEEEALEDRDGARLAAGVRARRRRERGDEAVEEGQVVRVVPAGRRASGGTG